VRGTYYVGSIKTYASCQGVSSDILAQLSDYEIEELKEALRPNEPKPFQSLGSLAMYLKWASDEITTCSKQYGPTETKKLLEAKVKAANDAWAIFFRTAQECGLKRKRNAKTRPPATLQ
jgi:hypothetical protein